MTVHQNRPCPRCGYRQCVRVDGYVFMHKLSVGTSREHWCRASRMRLRDVLAELAEESATSA